ncbi:MAG: exonuclease domain-containing protein [Coriobacteriia bacterium]
MLGPTSLTTGAFVTVDIETTGCRPGTSSIIEIGAVRIEAGVITGHFSRLVRPTEPIPPAIGRLTGITGMMVAQAPGVLDVMDEFRLFASEAVLVAHNHRFDMSFLDYEAERTWGSPFARPVLDTLTLARRLHPQLQRHNLRDLAAFYQTPTAPNHRAHVDALATAEVFVRMLAELDPAGITTAADVARLCGVAQQSRLARKLTLTTHLPDTPGIYLFRDAEGRVVYVGRAKCLRTRVRNHFYAPDDLASPSPASEVETIQHFPLVSALDAALLEARMQDRYQPAFNKDGHQRRRPLYLHVDTTSAYPSLRPTRRRLRTGELLGPLSSEWAATTIAHALSEFFGLRQCRCPIEQCLGKDCVHRIDRHCTMGADGEAAREAYEAGVRAALAIFDGDGTEFREMLRIAQERCAKSERYEDAARYRDSIRALDRTLSALATARRACSEGVAAIIEGDEERVTILVIVRGWLLATVRCGREEARSDELRARVGLTLRRAVRTLKGDPPVTAGRLREMAMIDSYRRQHHPVTVVLDAAPDEATESVMSAVRRVMHLPKKRHGAA